MKSKEQSLSANETGELILPTSVLDAIHNGASFQSKALTSNFSETGNSGETIKQYVATNNHWASRAQVYQLTAVSTISSHLTTRQPT